jgi:hypothetical protein
MIKLKRLWENQLHLLQPHPSHKKRRSQPQLLKKRKKRCNSRELSLRKWT